MDTRSSGLPAHAALAAVGVVFGAVAAVLWQAHRPAPAEVWLRRISNHLLSLEHPGWAKIRRSPSGPTVTSFRRGTVLPSRKWPFWEGPYLERRPDALWCSVSGVHEFRTPLRVFELAESASCDSETWHLGRVGER